MILRKWVDFLRGVVSTPWLSVVENTSSQETSTHIVTIYVSADLPEAGLMLQQRYHSNTADTWQQNEWLLDTELDAAIEDALRDADLSADDIDYINAHGTSTPLNDPIETRAIRSLFGDYAYRVPISSTKSMTGHGIGAAGGLELIFCLGMMEKGFIAPSINIETLDAAVEGLPVVTETQKRDMTTILSNNFGFGGTNATLVLRKLDD